MKARGRVTPQSRADGQAVILRPEIRESFEASQRYQPESSSVIPHNQRRLSNSFRTPSQKRNTFFDTSFREANYLFPASKLDSHGFPGLVEGIICIRGSFLNHVCPAACQRLAGRRPTRHRATTMACVCRSFLPCTRSKYDTRLHRGRPRAGRAHAWQRTHRHAA